MFLIVLEAACPALRERHIIRNDLLGRAFPATNAISAHASSKHNKQGLPEFLDWRAI